MTVNRVCEPASRFVPSDEDVQQLIRRAGGHALGPEFLVNGAQDAVAAVFGVHAFVVDAARAHLAGEAPKSAPGKR